MSTRIARESTLVRRHQITEAALNLITSKGMEAATIDAIAEEVGITEGAIYRHFSSKNQILRSLIDEIEASLIDSMDSAKNMGHDALESLRLIMEAHLSDVESYRAASFIIISEAVAFDGIGLSSRVGSLLANYLQFIQECIRDGIKEGSIGQEIDVEAAATIFLGLVQSTATLWSINEHTPGLAAKRSDMWNIYRRGITV